MLAYIFEFHSLMQTSASMADNLQNLWSKIMHLLWSVKNETVSANPMLEQIQIYRVTSKLPGID